MKLRVLHMYHDILDLYGDKGNIAALKYRTEARGIQFHLDHCGIGCEKNLSEFNLIFLGGGADREQSLISADLLSRKDDIIAALDSGTKALLICGGYQLFGKYYIDASGKKIPGLGIFTYHTEAPQDGNRCIGNILIEANLGGETFEILGFENHGGRTIDVEKPLGRVIHGNGNTYKSQFEGCHDRGVIATYMHGPLLPKNPKLTDYIIEQAIGTKIKKLDTTLEDQAFEHIASKLRNS